jgi:MSHA pilin protein MshA
MVNKRRKQAQKGFTLIELIIVIVIVAILAAVAIPTYLDLQEDAKRSASKGMAGALGSASAANYAIRSGFGSGTGSKGTAIANCTAVSALIQGGVPATYSITPAAIAAGATADCVINHDGGVASTAATFVGHGIS